MPTPNILSSAFPKDLLYSASKFLNIDLLTILN